jgi:hypothetical protein
MRQDFWRVGDPTLISFLQHLAALVGTNSGDRDRLAAAFVQAAPVDETLIAALIALTERYITLANSAPSTDLAILMHGHLRILEYLGLNDSPTYRRQLKLQAGCIRQALDQVRRTVR